MPNEFEVVSWGDCRRGKSGLVRHLRGRLHHLSRVLAASALMVVSARSESLVIPKGSAMDKADPVLARLLLNPLEDGGVIELGGLKLKGSLASVYPGLEPKAGVVALKFEGTAEVAGAKGNFVLNEFLPVDLRYLGIWVYLSAKSNVKELGLEVVDAEGESLSSVVSADWDGWKWVELNLQEAAFQQSSKQDGKNGRIDFPLKKISFAWISKEAGVTSLGVDGLAAIGQSVEGGKPYLLQTIGQPCGEPGHPFSAQLLVNNLTDQPQELSVHYSIQRNPGLYDRPLPDPVLGSDLAQGRPSWLEIDGERIDDDSLTDDEELTSYSSEAIKGHYSEAFQFVDLGAVHKVTALAYLAGDANKIYKLDIAVSEDGKDYKPVDELQGMDVNKKWSRKIKVNTPFPTRYLRLRYHKDGEKMDVIRGMATLHVYDGVADEKLDIPAVGEMVEEKAIKVKVAPKNFTLVPLPLVTPLQTDSYLFGVKAEGSSGPQLTVSNYFVMPEENVKLRPESRFGVNVSAPAHIPVLQQLGVGWVRYENMKWKMFNPAPGDFRFDGSVGPWNVPLEDYMRQYREAGFSILPYIFQTPEWATSAPEGTKENRSGYPPKDYSTYGDAIYELVARFGSMKHPAGELKTTDAKSGLNLMNTYELWNEPNLNAPGWGSFVGPLSAYLDLFRVGAEAVKRGDPKALVTSCGFAGLSMDWIDQMRTHKYPDGKCPIDFADILNVHFYSGRQEPELATTDPNAFREGAKAQQNIAVREGVNIEELQTYEKDLIDLVDWRNRLKPGMQIWLTETGYDVGGPIGRTERFQAAKLPRCLMIALANGLDKVFVYREKGSLPRQHGGAGLLRNNGSLRPSYFTMATLIRQLDGVANGRILRLQTPNSRIWMYRWKRGAEDVVTAWTPGGAGEPLGLDLGRCKVTNAFGGVSEVEVGKAFKVGEFPVYITQISNPAPIEALAREAAVREKERLASCELMSKKRAYLFDFGSREYVGMKKVGYPRPFVAVLGEDVYDKAKGFGFLSPAGENDVRNYVRSSTDKDSVQWRREDVFRIDAEPGVYDLEFKADLVSDGVKLAVRGGKDGEITLPLQKGKCQVASRVSVNPGQPLELQLSGKGRVMWATLIEATTGKPVR